MAKTGPKPKPESERFWSKVLSGDGCWEWTASKDRKGYGKFGPTKSAHRVSYELERGPIPSGLFVCHHCDNPSCVRPSHLFLGTVQDNVDDMISKGRQGIQAKALSPEMTAEALRLRASGITEREVARILGVSKNTIWRATRAAARLGEHGFSRIAWDVIDSDDAFDFQVITSAPAGAE